MSLDLAMSLRMGTKHGKHGGGPPPSYTGPLDLTATPAVVAYGQRALSAARLGTALYTIRRDSDDTTQSFNSDASDGTAPVATISAFIGGGNGFVTLWNDQSGNAANGVQATTGNQPGWAASVQNSQPGLTFDAVTRQWLATAGTITLPAGANTVFIVGSLNPSPVESTLTTSFVGLNFDDFAGPDGPDWGFRGEELTAPFALQVTGDSVNFNTFYSYASERVLAAATVYLLEAAADASSGELRVNGTVQALAQNTTGAIGDVIWPLGIGSADPAASANGEIQYLLDGQIIEIIIFPAVLSDSDRTAIRQNIATYYGVVLG